MEDLYINLYSPGISREDAHAVCNKYITVAEIWIADNYYTSYPEEGWTDIIIRNFGRGVHGKIYVEGVVILYIFSRDTTELNMLKELLSEFSAMKIPAHLYDPIITTRHVIALKSSEMFSAKKIPDDSLISEVRSTYREIFGEDVTIWPRAAGRDKHAFNMVLKYRKYGDTFRHHGYIHNYDWTLWMDVHGMPHAPVKELLLQLKDALLTSAHHSYD